MSSELTREDFLRELYKLPNGQLRALAASQGLPLATGGATAKAYIIHDMLIAMGYRGLTELEANAEQKLADLTPTTPQSAGAHPLTKRWKALDAALAAADSEFYLLRTDLERLHPNDTTTHTDLIQIRDDLMRVRKRLREKVKHRWNL